MPREQVTSSVPRTPGEQPGYAVMVGWQRDADVQVGVVTEDGRSLFWALAGNDEHRERFGVALREAMIEQEKTGSLTPDELATLVLNTLDVSAMHLYDGVWCHLRRHECNDLIRVVRRARDQAFGKDE